ncbi:hypothetical protein [Vibrio sp. WXL210]|uniref:hypothetical protein n=1 Tax=Vibrio sp. WXL210 TaxID=3450709 RepID=UPI003EC6439A
MLGRIGLTVILLISSFAVAAQSAGGSGGIGGIPSLSKAQLEAQWDGKAGKQSTRIMGIVANWRADVCGTLNGTETDANQCAVNTPKATRQ